MQHILDHAAVTVVADAEYLNAELTGAGDIHVSAFFGIQRTAHADVFDVFAAADDVAGDAGGVADEDALRRIAHRMNLRHFVSGSIIEFFFFHQ